MVAMKLKEFREFVGSVIAGHPKGRPMQGNKLVPDPLPMAPPVGYKKQPSMVEVVREMVRSEKLRQEVISAGAETFEESNDFDVGDDYDPSTPFEDYFDPVEDEAHRRLTEREFDAKVEDRLRLAHAKLMESDDGYRRSFEGRIDDRGERSGRAHSKRKGKSGSQSKSDHEGSVRDADGGSGEAED